MFFGEVKCLFSTALEAEKRRRRSGVFFTEKRQPDTESDAGPAQSRMDLRVRSARLGFVTERWSGLTSTFGQFT
jgi:hypothetical protein